MTNAILRPRALAITLGLVLAASAVALSFSPIQSVVPSVGAASADYYLEIEGIKGESTADPHKGGIQIESWSWGVSQTGSMSTGGGMTGGKMAPKPIVITKTVDVASTDIFKACASGKRIPKVTLFATRPSSEGRSQDYLSYTFSDVVCTSFQNEGSGGDRPMESISFNYTKIEMKYLPASSTGSTGTWKAAGWDLKLNKGI